MAEIQKEWPPSVCIRLTRVCNAKCDFCQAPYIDSNVLDLDLLGSIAHRLASEGVKSVKLSGGEPTVRSDIVGVVRVFAQAGLRVVLITNGIRVTPHLLEVLREVGGAIKFSIHFPDERNDAVLGNKSFEKVQQNLVAAAQCGVSTAINCVLSRRNIGEIEQMIKFAQRAGAKKISFIPLVFRGNARDNISNMEMSQELYRQVLTDIARHREASGFDVRVIDIRSKDFWVIENNGDLLIERETEEFDEALFGREEWRTTG